MRKAMPPMRPAIPIPAFAPILSPLFGSFEAESTLLEEVFGSAAFESALAVIEAVGEDDDGDVVKDVNEDDNADTIEPL